MKFHNPLLTLLLVVRATNGYLSNKNAFDLSMPKFVLTNYDMSNDKFQKRLASAYEDWCCTYKDGGISEESRMQVFAYHFFQAESYTNMTGLPCILNEYADMTAAEYRHFQEMQDMIDGQKVDTEEYNHPDFHFLEATASSNLHFLFQQTSTSNNKNLVANSVEVKVKKQEAEHVLEQEVQIQETKTSEYSLHQNLSGSRKFMEKTIRKIASKAREYTFHQSRLQQKLKLDHMARIRAKKLRECRFHQNLLKTRLDMENAAILERKQEQEKTVEMEKMFREKMKLAEEIVNDLASRKDFVVKFSVEKQREYNLHRNLLTARLQMEQTAKTKKSSSKKYIIDTNDHVFHSLDTTASKSNKKKIAVKAEILVHSDTMVGFKMPLIASGRILGWCKKIGDYVQAGDYLLVVECDDYEVFIRAPLNGYLASALQHEGDAVALNSILGIQASQQSHIEGISASWLNTELAATLEVFDTAIYTSLQTGDLHAAAVASELAGEHLAEMQDFESTCEQDIGLTLSIERQVTDAYFSQAQDFYKGSIGVDPKTAAVFTADEEDDFVQHLKRDVASQ